MYFLIIAHIHVTEWQFGMRMSTSIYRNQDEPARQYTFCCYHHPDTQATIIVEYNRFASGCYRRHVGNPLPAAVIRFYPAILVLE
jgi:hypothetical protein